MAALVDSAPYEGNESLDAHGVCVQRCACTAQVCEACFAEILQGLDRMLALPGPMTPRPVLRDFMPVATSRAAVKEPTHRRDFKLPFSSVESVITALLSGSAGAILVDALGRDAELCELTVIRSAPGADSQEWHGDSDWSAAGPRLCTVFLALHDILEQEMGPTSFCPDTHAPRCYPDKRWVPPTWALVAEKPVMSFALKAGDAVLMDSLTWHKGGANTSERMRTLLSATFVQGKGGADSSNLRLDDFV